MPPSENKAWAPLDKPQRNKISSLIKGTARLCFPLTGFLSWKQMFCVTNQGGIPTCWSSLMSNYSLYQWTPQGSDWESVCPQYLLQGSHLVSALSKHLGLNLNFTGSCPWSPRCVQEYSWTLKKLGCIWGTSPAFTWMQSRAVANSLKQRRCA